MICVSCLKECVPSEEHIFPESLGGTLVFYDVCKKCNDYFGHSVDIWLIEHWLIQGQRMSKGLRGKSGKVPNTLANGTLGDNEKIKVQIKTDETGQPSETHIIPYREVKNNDDGTISFSLFVDESDEDKIPEMVNKYLRRNNLPEMSAEEISSKKQKYHDATTRMNMSIEYDTVKYQIGILKIIYELACYWLGSVYVQTDDTAKLLRECVWDKAESIANYEIRGQIGNAQGSPIGAMFSKATDMHIGCLVQSGNDLAIYVRVFNTFEGTVAVSSHASNFVKSQDTLLRAVVIDPVKGDIHEGDFLEIMRKFT